MSQQLTIDEARLWKTFDVSNAIGHIAERGLCRLSLTDEDKRMRDIFVGWAKESGFGVRIDSIGNIFVRRPGSDDALPPVLVGSHLDTQILGGRYDGILGVLAGLEALRSLEDRRLATRRPIELVCWTEEEGARFSMSMVGSSVFAGIFELDKVRAMTDGEGRRLGDELRRIGYEGPSPVAGHPIDSYFELHIEQGPTLDRSDIDVGIVHGSYFVRGFDIRFVGDTAHIGPTPMKERHNALVGAGYLIAAVNDVGLKYSADDAKTTVSRIECQPNRYGIIPDRVMVTIDYRHHDLDTVNRMRAEIDEAIARAAETSQTKAEIVRSWSFGDEAFAAECVAVLREAAEDLGIRYRLMKSQAGHDAYSIAKIAPTAMIFTPCVDGISHNVREDIEAARTLPGVNLLLNAVYRHANRP